MYTDDTGKDVYSPWTLEGLATETVSRTQLRGAFFGPNTNGETVASMLADCRCLVCCAGAQFDRELGRGGMEVAWQPYVLLNPYGSELLGCRLYMNDLFTIATHLPPTLQLPADASGRRGGAGRQQSHELRRAAVQRLCVSAGHLTVDVARLGCWHCICHAWHVPVHQPHVARMAPNTLSLRRPHCIPRSNGIALQWSYCDSDAWVAAASFLAQQQLAAQGDSLANYPFK